jgi:long-subunit fatty acid transport protein
MRKTKIAILALFISIFLIPYAYAGINSNAGTTAYSFLKIGVGARAVAMGSAFVGLADDQSAIYFNPAGLTQLQNRSFTTSYNNYLTDIQSGFIGYIHPYDEKTRLGISINYFNYGSFDKTDRNGENLGTFGAADFALIATYARKVNPLISLGVNAKFILEKIDNYTSDALALDIGAFHKSEKKKIQVGVMVQNLGYQLNGLSKEHKESLPAEIKVGVSHYVHGLPLLVAVDGAKPFDNDIYFSLGAELSSFKPVFLRMGWSSFGKNYKTGSDKDNLAGFSFGLGVNWKVYRFDYAYSSYADLGGVHRISISGDLK